MSNNIKIGVELSDNGSSAKTSKNVKNVKDVLDQTTTSANTATKAINNMNTATQASGAAKAPGSATTAKIKRATGGGSGGGGNRGGSGGAMEDAGDGRGQYAAQRGAIGTGAAGRDFSKESQGLGGLVRLYATFAANMFAAAAAFNALSDAMDTANMVKGLDQLGAAQGKNLGSLAKQLTAVTDGAISLRESLTAIAQTSASGMTSGNILKLGEVAKKASQALGISMPDAVNRLSRGITKLEPELLDELGIFTKIDKATEDYARTVGKTAGSLTDFEKRQAFANAVLDEGSKKFDAIKVDVNPYTQLAASFKNTVDAGLNLVNKVLTPIVSLLATSPTALITVMAAIAGILLKQALPALGAFKANLDKSVTLAAENSRKLADIAEKASLAELDRAKRIATEKADFEFNKSEQALKRIETLNRVKGTKGVGDKAVNILTKLPQDLTDKDFNKLEQIQRNVKTPGAAAALREGIDTAKAAKDAAEQQVIARNKYQEQELNNAKTNSAVSIQKQAAIKAEAASIGLVIRSRAQENLQVLGLAQSYKLLTAEILAAQRAGQMDKTTAGWTKFAGTIGLVAGAVGKLAQSFSAAFIYLGIAIAVFEILDKFLSTSGKQASAFSSAADTLTSSLENVEKTIDGIYNKPLAEAFSIEAIQARATALVDLGQSLENMANAFDKLINAQSDWDRGWDNLKDLFGMSAGDKLAEGLANSVTDSLKLLKEGPTKEEAKKVFQEIYGADVDLTNIKSMDLAIDKLTRPEQAQKAKELAAQIKKVGTEQANQASVLTTLKAGLEETGKLVDNFNNSLKATDNFSKIGNQLLINYRDMSQALGNTNTSLAAMNALVNDTKTLSLLPPDIAASVLSLKDEVNKLYADANTNEAKLQKATEDNQQAIVKWAEEKKKYAGLDLDDPKVQLTRGAEEIKIAKNRTEAEIRVAETRKKSLDEAKAALELKFKEINGAMFDAGLKKLEQGLKGAFAEAGIIAAKGYVSLIQAAGGNTAALENKLQQEEIAVQIQSTNALYENSRNLKELSAQISYNSAIQDRIVTQGQLAGKELLKPQDVTLLEDKLKKLNAEIPKLEVLKDFYAAPSRGKLKALQGGAEDSAERSAAMEVGASGFASEMFGKEGTVAKLNAQLKVLKLSQTIVIPAQEATRLEEVRLKTIEAYNSRALDQLGISQNIVGVYSEELATKRNALELSLIDNKRAQELLKTTEQIKIAKDTLDRPEIKNDVRANAEKSLQEAQDRRQQIELKYIYEIDKTKKAQVAAALDGIEKQRQAEVSRQNAVLGFVRSEAEARLALQEQELNLMNIKGIVSETYLANANALIVTKRQELQVAQELKAVEDAKLTTQIDFENKRKKLPEVFAPEVGMIKDPAAVAALKEQEIAALAVLDRQAQSIRTVNDLKTQGNELTRLGQLETAATNKRLEEQTTAMEKLQGVAEALGTVFSEFGKSLGTGLVGMLKATDDFTNKRIEADKKYSKDKLDLEKSQAEEIANIQDSEGFGIDVEEARLKAKKDQTKDSLKLEKDYNKKSAQLELDKNIALVSSAKSMFKEKTLAYKVLNAVEKAMHLASMVMKVQAMVADGAFTAKSIANGMERMFISGKEAIMNAYAKIPPPFNIAAAAVMTALVAALIGKALGGGGGGGGVPAGFKAEEQQKVQGTGQAYVGGKLVETGGGVFGDITAKSTSIEDSLDIIRDTSVEGITLNNDMLKALQNIDKNTQSTARNLYSIPGIRTGSLFGTEEGTKKSGINGLFGKQVTKEIADAGIEFKGTILDFANATSQGIRLYENVITTTKSSGFLGIGGGTSTSTNTEFKKLDQVVQNQISEIFNNATELFITYGKKLGQTESQVLATLASIPVEKLASLRGLTGEDFAKEFSAVVGSILDDTSAVLFTQLSQYKKFGEGFLETAVRVFDTNDKVTAAFKSIGVNYAFSIGDTEALADSANGIKEFLEKISNFNKTYLTQGERLVPKQEALRQELYKLGYSYVDTKEEFKNLIYSFDATNRATLPLYNSLLDLQTAFDVVASQAEKYNEALQDQKIKMGALGIAGGLTPDQAKTVQRQREITKITEEYTATQAALLITNRQAIWQAEDNLDIRKQEIELLEALGDTVGALYRKREEELKGLTLTAQELKRRIWLLQDEKKVLTARSAQEIQIYELLGNASEALNLKREAELEAMYAALRPGQRYIYALQDQKTIYDKLNTTITNTTTSLKTSIQAIKDYQLSLKTGDKTILTPDEIYAIRQQEFFDLKSIADSVATTPAEEILKAAAISKLPTAADAFLESSRALFASSEQYTENFNIVEETLTSLATSLTGQLSDAERSLAELTSANGHLTSINDYTKTTAELMAELVAANANVAITRAAASAAGSTAAGGNADNFNTGASAAIPPVTQPASTTSGTDTAPVDESLTGLTGLQAIVLGWYRQSPLAKLSQPNDPARADLSYWADSIALSGTQVAKRAFDYAVKRDSVEKWYLNHPLIRAAGDSEGIAYWTSQIREDTVEEMNRVKFAFSGIVSRTRGATDTVPISAFAKGGLASGFSLVGEEGPELVDFQTPGRVYPAGQTTAMLSNNTALVQEIKALRQEVEKLRNEQKEQTGALIGGNYDANRRAAEQIVKATNDAANSNWSKRNTVTVV